MTAMKPAWLWRVRFVKKKSGNPKNNKGSNWKMKKCTLGPRHKWDFVKNVTVRSENISMNRHSIHIGQKGAYKCACGAKKYGDIR